MSTMCEGLSMILEFDGLNKLQCYYVMFCCFHEYGNGFKLSYMCVLVMIVV